MAGDWIKFENVTPDKPEVFQIAETLAIDPDAVTGKLVRIWIWADQQTADGNVRGVTRSLLDRITGVSGFADALIGVGWLEQTDNGLTFVNFDRHNGKTAKARGLTTKRVSKHRASVTEPETKGKRLGNEESVTKSLPEKRREEKSKEEDSRRGDESPKDFVWRVGVDLLTSAGEKNQSARSFLGKLCKDYGDEKVREAVGRAVAVAPAEPKAWIQGALKNGSGADFDDGVYI